MPTAVGARSQGHQKSTDLPLHPWPLTPDSLMGDGHRRILPGLHKFCGHPGSGSQEGLWMWLGAAEMGTVTAELEGSSSEGTASGENSLSVP